MAGPDSPNDGRTKRHCDGCSACCIHLPLPAGAVGGVGKPAGVSCPHRRSFGCRVYPTRPELCRRFCCEWLRDPRWPEVWRPDRSGLLCLAERLPEAPGVAGVVYEIRPGALGLSLSQGVLARLLDRTQGRLVVVRADGSRRRLAGTRGRSPSDRLGEPRRAA